MQSLDWAETPVGAVESWSQSLKSTVHTLLGSRYPMILLWEQDLIQIYNDAYINLIGTKHPYALGRSIRETQAESWDVIGPMITQVMTSGIPNWVEDQMLAVNRSGYNEEAHFSLSYSAVEDDLGVIRGMLCVCSEITQQILGERRLRLQRDLAARAGDSRSVEATCQDILAAMAEYPLDVPFALIYLQHQGNQRLQLSGSVGLNGNQDIAPTTVTLADSTDRWGLVQAMAGQPIVIRDLERDLKISGGPWGDPVAQAIALPIPSATVTAPLGVLICGISPNRGLDEGYQSFYELLAGQVSVSIRNARAYEEERHRAEMLAEIDRAKTVFFSNISHEFRTPLTLMLNPLEEVIQNSSLSASDRAQLAIAQRNTQRLLKLVNTLLDFSRIEAGRIQATYEPTDLAGLTADLASMFRSATEKAGLQLVVDCPPLAEPVYVDQQMWEKIVLNLLSNAFKFTFEGQILVSLQATDGAVELTVKDTGTGIPNQELPHLFERFHRVAGARGRSFEGSGIGLSLVQELVNLHGGSVKVTSVLGEGSRFRVRLPLGCAHLPPEQIQAAKNQTSPAASTAAYIQEALGWVTATEETPTPVLPTAPGARLLLADDNADMRHYLQRLLSQHYEVDAVADGEAALAALRQRRYDLVLSDGMMPRMDGFELLRQLRNDPETRVLPIILLSARAGEEAAIAALEAGADDYLVKPFKPRELLARIATNLELGRSRQADSQQRFRFLAELIPQMVWTADARGQVDYYNPRWFDYTGLTPTQTQSLGWQNLVHPDERLPSIQRWTEAVRQGTTYDIEHRLRRADGTYHWHLTRAQPLCNDQGQVIRWFGTCTNITDRKQAEAKVQMLNQQLTDRVTELQTLFDLLPVGVTIADDPDCRRVRANSYMSELLRLPIGANASQNAPADERPAYRLCRDGAEIPIPDLPMQYAARHNVEVRDEVVDLVHPDGTLVKLLCYASPLVDDQGQVRGVLGAFVDITQRVLTETALRESQALFAAFMHHSPTTAYIKDGEGRYLYVNPLTERMFNLPLAEWIGKTDFELFPQTATEQWRSHDLAALAAGQAIEIEEALTRAEGEQHFISFKFPIPHPSGKQLLGGMSLDVTQRKQAEAALRESMAILSTINQATPTLLYVKDRQGRLLMANPATVRLIGKPETDLLGKTSRDFLPPDAAEQITENDRQVMETGQVEVFEETLEFPEGRRTFLSTKSPYRDERGEIIGLVGVSTDITDRKQAELEREQLFARERHYVNQLQGLTTAALAINSALSVEQVLQLITDQAASIIGAHQSATLMATDQNWSGAIHAVYLSEKYTSGQNYQNAPGRLGIYPGIHLLESPLRLSQAELETHLHWREFARTGVNDPPLRGLLAAPLVGRDGKNIGLIQLSDKNEGEFTAADEAILVQLAQMASVSIENARLYEAEQQARSIAEASREAAQSANRIKDEFLAVLSHELRSPLNPILGWSKLLQNGKLDAARTKQALTTIERNAKLQSELIEDLLDVSRILQGKLSLTPSPMNLATTIQAAIETMRLAAEAKSIQIETHLAPGVGLISGDPTRLQQVVWNLLSNAVKFTPVGGQVTVQLLKLGHQAQLTVQDTGQGIDASFLPYVFDYFRQQDGATTRKFGGLGLGLAIVRHLVELHGGTIQAESPGEGLGATFTIHLPLLASQPSIAQEPPGSEPTLNLQGVQVLIVDDDTDTRDFIGFLLEQAGARVVAATSAGEALAMLRHSQPDVLVSDIGMPDMDGYMLMQQLRKLAPEQGGRIPAIALTAYTGEFNQQQARSVGFQKHIAKPVEPETLIGAVRSLVEESAPSKS